MIDYKYNTECIYYYIFQDMSGVYYSCSKKSGGIEIHGWGCAPAECENCNDYINRREAMQKLEEIGFRSENKLVR